MTYKLDIQEIGGVRFVSGYRLVSEHGRPSTDDEVENPPMEIGPDGGKRVAKLRDQNGKLRFSADPNPGHGKRRGLAVIEDDDEIDDRRVLIVERRQDLTPAEIASSTHAARLARVVEALPELLLAAADGKEIGEEVRKLLSDLEVRP